MTTVRPVSAATRARAAVARRLASGYCGTLLHIDGRWHCWTGRCWAEDDRGEAVRAVLDTAQAIAADPTTDADLREAVRRCGTTTELTAVLHAAAALPALSGTAADLAGPAPDPTRADDGRWSLAYCGSLRGGRPTHEHTVETRGRNEHRAPGCGPHLSADQRASGYTFTTQKG